MPPVSPTPPTAAGANSCGEPSTGLTFWGDGAMLVRETVNHVDEGVRHGRHPRTARPHPRAGGRPVHLARHPVARIDRHQRLAGRTRTRDAGHPAPAHPRGGLRRPRRACRGAPRRGAFRRGARRRDRRARRRALLAGARGRGAAARLLLPARRWPGTAGGGRALPPAVGPVTEVPLARLLAMAYRQLVDGLHERLADRGWTDVRPAFGFVLLALRAGPRSLRALPGVRGTSKQAVSKRVAAMVAAGYVEQDPHPADARAKQVQLSDRGRTL